MRSRGLPCWLISLSLTPSDTQQGCWESASRGRAFHWFSFSFLKNRVIMCPSEPNEWKAWSNPCLESVTLKLYMMGNIPKAPDVVFSGQWAGEHNSRGSSWRQMDIAGCRFQSSTWAGMHLDWCCAERGLGSFLNYRVFTGTGPCISRNIWVLCERNIIVMTWSASSMVRKTSPQLVGISHQVEKHSPTEVKLLLGKRP